MFWKLAGMLPARAASDAARLAYACLHGRDILTQALTRFELDRQARAKVTLDHVHSERVDACIASTGPDGRILQSHLHRENFPWSNLQCVHDTLHKNLLKDDAVVRITDELPEAASALVPADGDR